MEPHFLLATFPLHSHISPALHFARRLVEQGARVTLSTTIYGQKYMIKSSSTNDPRISFAPFSDGFDEGLNPNDDRDLAMAQFKDLGRKNLTQLILSLARKGPPISCVIYTILVPWASHVAHNLSLPAYLLWIQPASLFVFYYHYFHGYENLINTRTKEDPFGSIDLPGLPLFKPHELPSFVLPSSPSVYSHIFSVFRELFKDLKEGKVLVNTFNALEYDFLSAIDGLELVGCGPLLPLAFLEEKDTKGTASSSNGLINESADYVRWLHSKPASSVVYIAFGSIFMLPIKQIEEISLGLIESRRPFLWVLRLPQDGSETDNGSDVLRQVKAKGGLIVPWCSQVEVLSHPSVGCFVTHCGWNSTLESIAAGVPMVAFPQWTDQGTNAKLIEEVWKVGVRVKKTEDGILEGEELNRCLDIVMGESGEEIRNNARKWKDLAREAGSGGGSSDRNLKDFVEEVSQEWKCRKL